MMSGVEHWNETFEEDSDVSDDDAAYKITPKGIAVLNLLECGLITDLDDMRAELFWYKFKEYMDKAGYIINE